MGKGKKKSGKKKDKQADLLDDAARSLKKFRRFSKQFRKLSTGQKLATGLALVAGGLVYLAKKSADEAGSLASHPDAHDAESTLASFETEEPENDSADDAAEDKTDELAKAVRKSKKRR